MITVRTILLVVLIAALAGGAGYWLGHRHGGEASKPDSDDAAGTQPAAQQEKPVVEVTVAPVRRGPIGETVTAYGSVVAQPGEVRVLSVGFECRIARMLTTAGQPVNADTELVNVEPSPDARASLLEAQAAAEAAKRDLDLAQQRFNDHLATNQELSAAQSAVRSAELKLQSLTERGIGAQQLKAGIAGLVAKVDVQEGQIVPAGGPLVEVVPADRIEVRLGVAPDDAAMLKPGDPVRVTSPAHSGDAIEGHIRVIEQRVDPATRLVNAFITLPPDAHPMLESFVTGEIARASADALIVPRNAVLPDESGTYTLFTIRDGHAVKHTVRVGLENDHETQVIADDIQPGDLVAVTGSYQLEEKMAVEIKPAESEAAEGAASQPASAPSTSTPTTTAPTTTAPAAAEGAP